MLNKQGVTIILTTHYILEAERMCNRIGILNKGNLVALDTTKNLLNRIQTKKVKFSVNKKVNIMSSESEIFFNQLKESGYEILVDKFSQEITSAKQTAESLTKTMPDSLMPRPDAAVGRNRDRFEFVLAEKSARVVDIKTWTKE